MSFGVIISVHETCFLCIHTMAFSSVHAPQCFVNNTIFHNVYPCCIKWQYIQTYGTIESGFIISTKCNLIHVWVLHKIVSDPSSVDAGHMVSGMGNNVNWGLCFTHTDTGCVFYGSPVRSNCTFLLQYGVYPAAR